MTKRDDLQGQYVIVRSHLSGVHFGVLEEQRLTDAGLFVLLSQKRKVWSWEGAGGTEGLAHHGPRGGKITFPAHLGLIGPCNEVLMCTDEAVVAFGRIKPWDAR